MSLLMQKRLERDQLAREVEFWIADYESTEKAHTIIDNICCAGPGWTSQLATVKQRVIERGAYYAAEEIDLLRKRVEEIATLERLGVHPNQCRALVPVRREVAHA